MDECGICFEPETDINNRIFVTNCKHSFHIQCMRWWIWYSDEIYSCPTCRRPMDCEIII